MKMGITIAISGPAKQEQEIFVWERKELPHRGLPEIWNFDWVNMDWNDS